jgi:hypothetical protein
MAGLTLKITEDSLMFEDGMEIRFDRMTYEQYPDVTELIKITLWDFPAEFKNINPQSIPVLKRRLTQMPLPQRKVLEKLLSNF